MFRRVTLVLTLALVGITALMIWRLVPFSESDLETLQSNVQGAKSDGDSSVEQYRRGLRRDLVEGSDDGRKHYILTSAGAYTHVDVLERHFDEELQTVSVTLDSEGTSEWELVSDSARYDGENLVLEGSVHAQGLQGVLETERITLVPEEGHPFKWEYAYIAGTVTLRNPEGAMLTAPHAEVSIPEKTIRFGDNVTITTVEGLELSASELVYFHDTDQIALTQVSGDAPYGEDSRIHFAATRADWDVNTEVLRLHEEISVEGDGLGELHASGQAEVLIGTEDGKRTLKHLEITGPTDAVLVSDGQIHQLRSPTRTVVDHQLARISFYSNDSSQVVFKSARQQLCANTIIADYSTTSEQPTLSHLVATGHVCLSNKPEDPADKEAMQYALADRLEHAVATQRSTLTAEAPTRVLLLDGQSGIAISAPGITLSIDPTTQKQRVQGIGDVRFTLMDREYQRIKERFPLERLPL